MSGRLTLVALIVSALLLFPAQIAQAAPGGGGGQGSGGQSGGVLGAGITFANGGDGGGGGDGCVWTLADGGLSDGSNGTATWPRVQDGVTIYLYERKCPGQPAVLVEVAETDPADLLPMLLERLRSQELPSPKPVFAQLDPTHGWAYVTVPVDFRAGGDSWRTVSVTASYGPVWATVTAVPSALQFDPGDPAGGGASCNSDGPTAGYVSATPGACSYTYTNASSTSPYDGYHFMTSMSIDWTVSWTSSTGAGGPLDGWTTAGSAPLAVARCRESSRPREPVRVKEDADGPHDRQTRHGCVDEWTPSAAALGGLGCESDEAQADLGAARRAHGRTVGRRRCVGLHRDVGTDVGRGRSTRHRTG